MFDCAGHAHTWKLEKIFSRRFCVTALLLVIFCWLALRIFWAVHDYDWAWSRVWRYFGVWSQEGFQPGPLCQGFYITICLALVALFLASATGLLLAVLRLSPWKLCGCFAALWIGIFRNTPLLLQLFFIYFLVSPLLGCGPFLAALIALTAFEGAYMAELFRGALLTIPKAQWEAGLSLGFNLGQCLRFFILPQAIRHGMPAFVNQAISVLKDTSLVGAIAVADLSMRAQEVVSESFLAFEIWFMVAFIYLVLGLLLSFLGAVLEKWLCRIPMA